MTAFQSKSVQIPKERDGLNGKPYFLPETAESADFDAGAVQKPRLLAAGIGSTGALARSLFSFLPVCTIWVGILMKRILFQGL